MEFSIKNYSDFGFKPKFSVVNSRSEVNTSARLCDSTFRVPVVAANMQSIVTVDICKKFDSHGYFYVYPRMKGSIDVLRFVESSQNFRVVSISVGVGEEWIDLLVRINVEGLRVDYITIDLAHSYSVVTIPTIEHIKKYFPNTYLIVGNGMTAEWIQWLETYEVDAAKVGLGNGSSCSTFHSTNFKSNVGSLIECISAAKKIDIIADGGFSIDPRSNLICVGQFAQALALGSTFCMSGNAFSGCIDTPSHSHGYFGNASEFCGNTKNIEGVKVNRDSNGKTMLEVMQHIEESLQSAVSYSGGKDLSALRRVDFIDLR